MMMEYKISFVSDVPNWVSISSIDRKTLDSFIDYLYSLKRDINVFPYIPGGGPFGNPCLDKTYVPKAIAKDIKQKVPVNKMLNNHITRDENDKSCFGIHFIEDVYEFYLSIGIEKKRAFETSINQYHCDEIKERLMINSFKNNRKLRKFAEWKGNNYVHYPYHSRWVFIYMFRNEFKKYMHDRGYKVVVDGGWIINDKKREMKLGLIDENGELY